MASKLDIFDVLEHVTMKDMGWLQSLPAEQQKGFQAVVVQKWIRGANRNPDSHIYATDAFVNPYVYSLWNHPVLLYKLLCVANGFKEKTRYRYLRPKASNSKKPLSIKVLREYYNVDHVRASEDVSVLDCHDIITLAEALGWESAEVKKVEKEWKL